MRSRVEKGGVLGWTPSLDEIMMEWFNKYAPGFMCVGLKPYHFGNEQHNLFVDKHIFLWRYHIVEGKALPGPLGQKEYYELRETVSLILRMCRPIFGSGEAVVLDSGFCVAKGITEIEAKGIYMEDLIKKRRYWPKGLPGDLIDAYFED